MVRERREAPLHPRQGGALGQRRQGAADGRILRDADGLAPVQERAGSACSGRHLAQPAHERVLHRGVGEPDEIVVHADTLARVHPARLGLVEPSDVHSGDARRMAGERRGQGPAAGGMRRHDDGVVGQHRPRDRDRRAALGELARWLAVPFAPSARTGVRPDPTAGIGSVRPSRRR